MSKPKLKILQNGIKTWRLNGLLHREDGPAIIWEDGTKEWRINGKLHREDGPALIHSDGDEEWYINGKRHREDGPAIIYNNNNNKVWYLNNKLISFNEYKEWFIRKIANPSYQLTDEDINFIKEYLEYCSQE